MGTGGDWAFYVGHLLANSAIFGLADDAIVLMAKGYALLGYGVNHAIGDDLVKLDMAYKHGLGHYVKGTGVTDARRLDVAVAADLKQDKWQWQASLTGQHWLDYHANYANVVFDPMAQMPVVISSAVTNWHYSLRLEDSSVDDIWHSSLMLAGSADGQMTGLMGGLSWRHSDQLHLDMTYATIQASAHKAYARLAGWRRLGLQLVYHF
jgi:hypothetical protein